MGRVKPEEPPGYSGKSSQFGWKPRRRARTPCGRAPRRQSGCETGCAGPRTPYRGTGRRRGRAGCRRFCGMRPSWADESRRCLVDETVEFLLGCFLNALGDFKIGVEELVSSSVRLLPWAPSRLSSWISRAASVSLMMRQALLYAMPIFAAAFSEPFSRTPRHKSAMPRPNTDPLSEFGFLIESLMDGVRLVSLLMGSPFRRFLLACGSLIVSLFCRGKPLLRARCPRSSYR